MINVIEILVDALYNGSEEYEELASTLDMQVIQFLQGGEGWSAIVGSGVTDDLLYIMYHNEAENTTSVDTWLRRDSFVKGVRPDTVKEDNNE